MISKTIPTNKNLDFQVVKFFGHDDKNFLLLPDSVSPDVIPFLSFFNLEFTDILYYKSNNTCSCCNSKLIESTIEEIHPNKLDHVYRIVYRCSKKGCNGKHRTCLDKFIKSNSNYTENMKYLSSNLKFIDEISFRKMSELFEAIIGIRIPKSTIYQHQDQIIDDLITVAEEEIEDIIIEEEIQPSGVCNYDEQFPKVSNNQKTTLSILDANTKYAYPILLIDNEKFNANIIKQYWNTQLDESSHQIIVTDGHKMYPSLFKELNFEQSLCNFHMILNIRKTPYKKINKNNRKIKNHEQKIIKIQNKIDDLEENYTPKRGRIAIRDTEQRELHDEIKENKKTISNLKAEIRKLKHENKELEKYMDKISLIFKSKTVTTAKKRFNKLLEEKEHIPDVITKSFKILENKFEKLIKHIENEYVPNTNNLVELFFEVICPKKLKKYYKTDKGLYRKLRINRIRWNYRVCLKRKTPIVKIFESKATNHALNF